MGKLILLVLIGLVVYWILKSYAKGAQQRSSTPPANTTEDMVRCAQCGVNLPISESILSQGNYFCSDDHRKLYQK